MLVLFLYARLGVLNLCRLLPLLTKLCNVKLEGGVMFRLCDNSHNLIISHPSVFVNRTKLL